jgi:hypothetical protein
MISEQGDLDVPAVGVHRGGSSLNGAVSHEVTVCHHAPACPHPVSGDRGPAAETRRACNGAAGVVLVAVCRFHERHRKAADEREGGQPVDPP